MDPATTPSKPAKSAPARKNRRVTPKLRPNAAPPSKASRRKRLALKILLWSGVGMVALIAVFSVVVAIMFWHYGRDPNLPSVSSLEEYHPKQVTRIVDRGGGLIGEVYTERRTYVAYKDIPRLVVDAFVSAEDADFWDHEGIDYFGMVRALFANMRSGKKKQGASTITQQVVKTMLLSPERTMRRKFQEIILARRLEKVLSKEEILTLYLNQIYFGGGRYGIVEAARYYFDKDLLQQDERNRLTIGEAAYLAGIPKSPEHLDAHEPGNQSYAKSRQEYVLGEMAKHGYIKDEEAAFWKKQRIVVVEAADAASAAPEWLTVARHELVTEHGEDALATLGAQVVTTRDPAIELAAREALRAGLRAYDQRKEVGRAVDGRRVKPDKIELELAKMARRLGGAPKPGERHDALVVEVHDGDARAPAAGSIVVDLGNYRATVALGGADEQRYNPDSLPASKRFQAGDLVRVVVDKPDAADTAGHTASFAPGPEGAVVVIDPRSREVLALVGGYAVKPGGFDRATMAHRQPGSVFKPFVYAAAIDGRDYNAASLVEDAPEIYGNWRPKNYEQDKSLGPVRLRKALALSVNLVAVRVIHDIGPDRVVDLAHKMGIESKLPAELSLALGSGEVTPLELTNAFATFAAGGMHAPPVFIAEESGAARPRPAADAALSPDVAYVVTDMMRSVVTEGTAARAAGKTRTKVAGKTGTSNDARDAWFVGMTPNLVVGVWIGYDDNRPLGRHEAGGSTAAPVFFDLLKRVGRRATEPTRDFARPAGVVEARIDKASGKLAPDGAPADSWYTEVFLDGTVPTETAPAPGEADATTYVLDEYDDAYSDETVGDDASGGAVDPYAAGAVERSPQAKP